VTRPDSDAEGPFEDATQRARPIRRRWNMTATVTETPVVESDAMKNVKIIDCGDLPTS
jgi:hypothetical protein